jgi:hypothetical protein
MCVSVHDSPRPGSTYGGYLSGAANFLQQTCVSLRRSRQSYGSNPNLLVHNRLCIRTSDPNNSYDPRRDPTCRDPGLIRPSLPSNDIHSNSAEWFSSICSDAFPVSGIAVVVRSMATTKCIIAV